MTCFKRFFLLFLIVGAKDIFAQARQCTNSSIRVSLDTISLCQNQIYWLTADTVGGAPISINWRLLPGQSPPNLSDSLSFLIPTTNAGSAQYIISAEFADNFPFPSTCVSRDTVTVIVKPLPNPPNVSFSPN